MKRITCTWIGLLVALVLSGAACLGETQANAGDAASENQEQAREMQASQDPKGPPEEAGASRPDWAQPDGLPKTVRERLQEFQERREAYLQEQLRLRREWFGATDEEREELREQIRQQHTRFLDEARAIREQVRDRVQEMVDELPRHRELMEAVRERVREQVEEARDRASERRGMD